MIVVSVISTSHVVLHCSGLSVAVTREVVVLVVVGMLINARGPYVDQHVVSVIVVLISYGERTDWGQPMVKISIQLMHALLLCEKGGIPFP